MKKITVILLAVLMFCVTCVTVSAETPEQKGVAISTEVPEYCYINFKSFEGRIEENGIAVKKREKYKRRSIHTFHIIPNKGKVINTLLYGGEDVTLQLEGSREDGYFTTPPITKDTTFEVIYRDADTSEEPSTESSVESSAEPSDEPSTEPSVEPSGSSDVSIPQISGSTDPAKTGDTTGIIVLIPAVVISAAFIIVLSGSRRKEIK